MVNLSLFDFTLIVFRSPVIYNTTVQIKTIATWKLLLYKTHWYCWFHLIMLATFRYHNYSLYYTFSIHTADHLSKLNLQITVAYVEPTNIQVCFVLCAVYLNFKFSNSSWTPKYYNPNHCYQLTEFVTEFMLCTIMRLVGWLNE